MKKCACAFAVAAALAAFSVPAMAESLTEEEMKTLLVGSTHLYYTYSQRTGSQGEHKVYLSPDGTFFSKNSWGDESSGIYIIHAEGKLCYDFKQFPSTWNFTNPLCYSFSKEGDTLKTGGRTIHKIVAGDAR